MSSRDTYTPSLTKLLAKDIFWAALKAVLFTPLALLILYFLFDLLAYIFKGVIPTISLYQQIIPQILSMAFSGCLLGLLLLIPATLILLKTLNRLYLKGKFRKTIFSICGLLWLGVIISNPPIHFPPGAYDHNLAYTTTFVVSGIAFYLLVYLLSIEKGFKKIQGESTVSNDLFFD